jgi:ribulose-bisphosphate carboxylase large chain
MQQDTHILACFRITPQPGVPREQVAIVAAGSSTGIRATVSTGLDQYEGRACASGDSPGDDTCHYAFMACPIELFEARVTT